jgi:hypothetical protein
MGPEGPRSRPGGRCHPRHPTAKQRLHCQLATPSRAPTSRRRRRNVDDLRHRRRQRRSGRASLQSLREEARPPPSAPRGLCPAACADGGGGEEGAARRLGFPSPLRARVGWCGAGFSFFWEVLVSREYMNRAQFAILNYRELNSESGGSIALLYVGFP